MPPDAENSSLPSGTGLYIRQAESTAASIQHYAAFRYLEPISYSPWIVWVQQTGADLLDLLESLHGAKSPDAQPTDSKSSG